ncbi:MAG: glycoside hydrolase family 3 protein [Erysipelotrichaceae bacterium]|nr:glycoside hydrolase family 3 protein [Erysipelotrichaceae bacterium]
MVNYREKPFYLDDEKIRWVEETLASLTLEEKCGQLFCIAAFGNLDQIIEMYDRLPYGSLMYRPNDAKSVERANRILREKLKVAPLVAANLESGGSGVAQEGTLYGPQLQVGASGRHENAFHLGQISAREAKAVGVNLAFAPVVDVNYNWRNPITNVRTYGSDAEEVLAYGRQYVKAALQEGIAVSIKHFPGDGVDERDQHIVASVNSLSTEEWDKTYGKIYKQLIEEGAQTVMAGHIMQPAYTRALNPGIKDGEIMPATLSKELITGLLRGKLGFNGVVITDATNMVGMCCMMERRKLVPASINAGCDIFLFGKNPFEDYGYLCDAARSGELPMERLNEAVSRVLALKASLNLHLPAEEKDTSVVGCAEHQKLAEELADQSVTLVKDTQHLLPITPKTHKRVWLHIIDEPGFTDPTTCEKVVLEEMERAGFEVYYDDNEPKGLPDTQIPVEELKKKYDVIIYFANIVNASYKTVTRLRWRSPAAIDAPYYTQDIPTMFVSLANPYHFADVPMIRTIINAYSPSRTTVRAVIQKMMGNSEFKGVNPVDPFCGLFGKDI